MLSPASSCGAGLREICSTYLEQLYANLFTAATGCCRSRVPNLICDCEEHSDVAISMRLSTRRRIAVATGTGLPRCARNDRVGRH